ncbi:MAG: rod shape-determining protein MreC [Alphaproteobacteria bacterium]|nr:rod shape-determining protein MreC [Alphaproteobacteria bacterium]
MKLKRRRLLFLNFSKIRQLTKKFAIIILFIFAFVFMLISKTDTIVIEKTSSVAGDLLGPIIDTLSIPAKFIASSYNYVSSLRKTYEENAKLKEENKVLHELRNQIRALEIENRLLTQLLNYIQPPQAKFVTVRIVASENDAFSNSVIAYTGDVENIKSGQIVLTQDGVIGRIEEVGKNYSKIYLITDINSKIPVIIERNRVRGILAGDNTDLVKLVFTPISTDIRVGDRIITSGVAGVFPPGIPVGKVVSTGKNNIRIKPYANIKNVEYVKVIEYVADEN